MIKQDKALWLRSAIGWRDEFAHYTTLKNFRFTAKTLPNGDVDAVAPCFKGHETILLFQTVFQNNLEFQQDFLSFSLALALPPGLDLGPADKAQMGQDFGPAGSFIRYSVFMQ